MWNAVKWLLLYIVVQFLIIFGFTFVYMANGNDPNLFGNFLNDNKIILVLLLGLIFIPLYLYKYKKFDIKEKSFDITKLIIFVVFLSVGYNILAYYLDKYVLLSGLYSNTSNILVGIISTVLLGPIIEELLFTSFFKPEPSDISFPAIMSASVILAIRISRADAYTSSIVPKNPPLSLSYVI